MKKYTNVFVIECETEGEAFDNNLVNSLIANNDWENDYLKRS